ncbi:TPA: DNA-binding protein [Escherichia coli]|nr:DNA-binding protein [Escherichia coli]
MKNEKLPSLSEVIRSVGVLAISRSCGCSKRAIYKWMKNEALPRTDYSGETNYAEKIAGASGGKFSVDLIKKISRPQKVTKSAA